MNVLRGGHSHKLRCLYHCHTCKYERWVAVDKDLLAEMTDHPIYGLVTYEELANLDVKNHLCGPHRAAVKRMKEYNGRLGKTQETRRNVEHAEATDIQA